MARDNPNESVISNPFGVKKVAPFSLLYMNSHVRSDLGLRGNDGLASRFVVTGTFLFFPQEGKK
jgi:hypothetical protein